MAENKRKEFGRRGAAPPVVTHAPQGLAGGPLGPSTLRKRSMTISLVAMGSLALGGYAVMEAFDKRVNCQPGQINPDQTNCTSASSRGSSERSWRLQLVVALIVFGLVLLFVAWRVRSAASVGMARRMAAAHEA